MLFKKVLGAATVSVALSVASANAGTLEYLGTLYGMEDVDTNQPGLSPVMAGEFVMENVSTGDIFLAYCLDLFVELQETAQYALGSIPTGISNALQGLYTNHYASVASSNESAAFQLAIWEIVNEDSGNGYSLDSGLFQSSGLNASAIATANGYLGNLAYTDALYQLSFWDGSQNNPASQDLISASPVPLPAAGWMLLAGLGGIAALRRRKKIA